VRRTLWLIVALYALAAATHYRARVVNYVLPPSGAKEMRDAQRELANGAHGRAEEAERRCKFWDEADWEALRREVRD
jgi:hypothetical protein